MWTVQPLLGCAAILLTDACDVNTGILKKLVFSLERSVFLLLGSLHIR